MKPLKYYPILDEDYGNEEKRVKLDNVITFIENEITNIMKLTENPEKADIIIVGGGDGYLLQIMRKFKDLDATFLGVNAGTKGFLMNHINNITSIPNTLEEFDIVEIPIIPITAKLKNGKEKSGFYLNEALLGGHVADFFTFKVSLKKKDIVIPGSGLVVNTPTGSTGYAANLKQPILDLASNMQGLAGIGTQGFDYGYFDPQKVIINDDRGRDQLDLILDGKHGMVLKNIEQVTIYPPKQTIKIAFTKEQNFQDRRVLLAQESNGNVIQ